MEELLNKLIEKGWKPRGLNIMGKIVIDYDIEFAFDIYDSLQKGHWNFRELVGKESGLWKFVCENGMAGSGWFSCINEAKGIKPIKYYDNSYEYRLIQSALLDEDKLEDFILDNIQLGQ